VEPVTHDSRGIARRSTTVPKLPVTIFTGFLGSGKTTLLASLLAAERERHFAVVVNEFGEVSVDDLLLQRSLDTCRARVFTLSKGLIAYADDDFVRMFQRCWSAILSGCMRPRATPKPTE